MTDYWMLLADDTVNVGDTVPITDADGRPNPVVTDPRGIEISEVLDGRARDELLDVVRNPRIRLARVSPMGEVRPHREFWEVTEAGFVMTDSTELEADGGWRVTSFEPLHLVLGPQGERVAAVAEELDRAFSDSASDAAVEVYQAEVEQLYDNWDEAMQAAAEALTEIGADGYWWECTVSCTWGTEILALGARDLIGRTPRWTQDAYDLLTRPWRAAFPDRLHPDDTPCTNASVSVKDLLALPSGTVGVLAGPVLAPVPGKPDCTTVGFVRVHNAGGRPVMVVACNDDVDSDAVLFPLRQPGSVLTAFTEHGPVDLLAGCADRAVLAARLDALQPGTVVASGVWSDGAAGTLAIKCDADEKPVAWRVSGCGIADESTLHYFLGLAPADATIAADYPQLATYTAELRLLPNEGPHALPVHNRATNS